MLGLNEFTITWTLNDICYFSPEDNLTDAEGRKVLHILHHNYDAYFGVNWTTIDKAVKKVVADRKVKADMSTFNKKASSTPVPLTKQQLKDFSSLEKWLGI